MASEPFIRRAVLAGVIVLLMPAYGDAREQGPCKAQDFTCMDREFERACVGPTPTIQSCLAWSKAVEASASRDPVAALMLGKSYVALSDLGAVAPKSEGYREMGVRTFKQLIAQDSSNFEAIFELALATQDTRERIRLLKEAVAIKPDIYALQLLASELIQSGNKADGLEAGKYMEQAYSHQSGPNKWHLAKRALQILESNGNSAEADRLRERVRSDFGGDSKVDRLKVDFSAKNAADTLKAVCYPAAIGAVGAAPCLSALNVVHAELARTPNRDVAQELANQLSNSVLVLVEVSDELTAVTPNWKNQFTNWIQELINRRLASVATYNAYAMITAHSATRIEALKKVAELTPNNAGAAIRLGEEYLRLGRYDDAIKEFERARANPPPSQEGAREFDRIVDQHVEQANALKTRASNSHHDLRH